MPKVLPANYALGRAVPAVTNLRIELRASRQLKSILKCKYMHVEGKYLLDMHFEVMHIWMVKNVSGYTYRG